jgi:putative ABC transport system ATP-binding protein
MALIEVHQVVKHYALGKTTVQALNGVSLAVEAGEFLAIAGPSGSGKSTLLNCIGCIEAPTCGIVRVDEQEVQHLSANERADLRARKLGFIFQTFNLLPVLTAIENVEYPLLLQAIPAHERQARASKALQQVGLESFARHRPMELSGGQRQRVAIARAIVTYPRIVLADEPTANLDHRTGDEILDLMQQINRSSQTTFVFSTHDPKVMQRASRIVHLLDGQIVG